MSLVMEGGSRVDAEGSGCFGLDFLRANVGSLYTTDQDQCGGSFTEEYTMLDSSSVQYRRSVESVQHIERPEKPEVQQTTFRNPTCITGVCILHISLYSTDSCSASSASVVFCSEASWLRFRVDGGNEDHFPSLLHISLYPTNLRLANSARADFRCIPVQEKTLA